MSLLSLRPCLMCERHIHFSNSKNCLTRSLHTHTHTNTHALQSILQPFEGWRMMIVTFRQNAGGNLNLFPVRSNEDKWPCLKRVELYVAERQSLWSCNVISNSLYWSCSDRLHVININLKSRVEYLFSGISSTKRSLRDLTQWIVSKVIMCTLYNHRSIKSPHITTDSSVIYHNEVAIKCRTQCGRQFNVTQPQTAVPKEPYNHRQKQCDAFWFIGEHGLSY